MTPSEQENPETSVERETTELHPFTPGHRWGPGGIAGAAPDWMPDWQQPGREGQPPSAAAAPPGLPVMEPLPGADALPDPGYPEMPATPPPVLLSPRLFPPAPSAPAPEPPGPAPALPEPAASALPLPDPEPPAPEPPAPEPPRPFQLAPRPASPPPAWTPEPYAAPRAPGEAPPLRGPAVPWPEVRARPGYPAASEPLAAPPALREPDAAATGTVAVPGAEARRPTADSLTSDVLLPGKRATPGDGWRRTVYRASGGLIRVGESAASRRRRDLVSRVRTPLAGGHHRVAVLSLKGGVGKTTVTVGLGSMLASLRGDRVVAVDGNPDRGTLSDKVRLQTSATIRDLLARRDLVRRYADVRMFTSQAPSRLEILASDRDPGVSVAFSADDYRAVVGVLDRYYSICITDCGTGLLHSAMAGILELADQVVLVSSPSVDGARSASATLDWLDAHGYGDLVLGGVVVLSAIRRGSKSAVDLNRLEQHFAARCRAVVRIPHDPHLEEGAEVDLDLLSQDTADAYLTLAALVADGFAHSPRSVSGAPGGPPLA
jgi:MinD-like ATPase involved in chromosome partitioning or flagellar assembly